MVTSWMCAHGHVLQFACELRDMKAGGADAESLRTRKVTARVSFFFFFFLCVCVCVCVCVCFCVFFLFRVLTHRLLLA